MRRPSLPIRIAIAIPFLAAALYLFKLDYNIATTAEPVHATFTDIAPPSKTDIEIAPAPKVIWSWTRPPEFKLDPHFESDATNLRFSIATDFPEGTRFRAVLSREVSEKKDPNVTMYPNAGFFVPTQDPGDVDPESNNPNMKLGEVHNGKMEGLFEIFPEKIQRLGVDASTPDMAIDEDHVLIWIEVEKDFPHQPATLATAHDEFYKFEFTTPLALKSAPQAMPTHAKDP